MTVEETARMMDVSAVQAQSTRQDIDACCALAAEFGCAAVFCLPAHVPYLRARLDTLGLMVPARAVSAWASTPPVRSSRRSERHVRPRIRLRQGRRVARASIGQQAAALGAALVAGVGAGMWDDFSILDSISHTDAEAAPDPEAAADYARRYARWRLLTDKLGEWAQT